VAEAAISIEEDTEGVAEGEVAPVMIARLAGSI
jgi:hypothetical protein